MGGSRAGSLFAFARESEGLAHVSQWDFRGMEDDDGIRTYERTLWIRLVDSILIVSLIDRSARKE